MDGLYQEGVGNVAGRVLELSDIPVTIAMPLRSHPHRERFNAIRWAYVFGGAALSQGTLGAPSAKRVIVSLPS
jgi:hypothetical protein